MNISDLQTAIHDNACAKGFWEPSDEAFLCQKLALVHSEVSEALEELRQQERNKDRFAGELADIVIRVLDLAEYLKIDLESIIEQKHKQNLTRPYKHSKRF